MDGARNLELPSVNRARPRNTPSDGWGLAVARGSVYGFSMSTVHDFTATSIDGSAKSLQDYAGLALVVNVARSAA